MLLTLASAVRAGETVTVSYTKPGMNLLKDVNNNEAESFTGQTVTNTLAATAPEAPGNLTATAGAADTMALTWETPWHNGDDITKFQVRYAEGSSAGGTWADITGSDASTTRHTVTGLLAGREYTFEVRAVNDIDDGAEATVTQTTGTPAWELTIGDANDAAVTELVEGGASATVTVRFTNAVTFSTAQTVTLEWDGLALDTINRIRGAGGVSAITIPPGQSSGTLVISAPDPGGVATYDPPRTAPLRGLHGENRLGEIDLTFRDDEAPPVATLTAQPSQVSEGGTIDVEIRLNPSFGAHATSTLGLAVTDADGALVAPLPSEAEFDSGEVTHALTLTVDDNAVQNDDAREVTVALVANPDASPYTLGAPSSVTVTVRDNDTPPSAPRSLTAEAGDGEVTLRWTAPATDNGQAVTGYGYRQKSGTGSFGGWTDITGSDVNTTEHTVDGLTNAIVHTFEVRAENPAGWSAESNQASRTPGVADTTAPVLLSATTTALALGLTYDEDLDPGSEPAPSAFTVTVDGASRAVIGVSLADAKVTPDPRLGGAPRRDGDGFVHRARGRPAPGRGEEPRRRLCRSRGDEPRPGDGARRPGEPRGDPRRRFGDAAVDGARPRRRARDHRPPVLPGGGAERLVHGRERLAGHHGQRAGRGERDRLHGNEAHERHRVHLPGAGGERGGSERRVQRGGHHPERRRHHRLAGGRAGAERGVRADGREPGAAHGERAPRRRRGLAGDGGRGAPREVGYGVARAPCGGGARR